MKRILAVLFILALTLCLCVGCTGKTPDQLEAEKADVTLEDIDWTVPITINATGETVNYTLTMAKAHELTKIYCSFRQFENADAQGAPQVTTMIFEGVLFKTVLEEIGVTDAEYIVVHHNNIEKDYEFDKDIIYGDECLIGWIQNKTNIVEDSFPSYVAFGASAAGGDDFVHSLKDITIY